MRVSNRPGLDGTINRSVSLNRASSAREAVLTSRTFTTRPAGTGTYGQSVPSERLDPAGTVHKFFIGGLQHYRNPDGSGYRTAIGLANRSDRAIAGVIIHLFNNQGMEVGSYETGLWAYGFRQIDRFVEKVLGPGSSLRDFSVMLETDSAKDPWVTIDMVAAYASVVDDTTGDAIFVTAVTLLRPR